VRERERDKCIFASCGSSCTHVGRLCQVCVRECVCMCVRVSVYVCESVCVCE